LRVRAGRAQRARRHVFQRANAGKLGLSFPGLLALVTGGSPNSHGLFYDVSYNRSIFDPANTTCAGKPGNMQVFDESIDLYDSSFVSQNVIDPATLPRYIDANGKCSPKYPHNAMRSNTIFDQSQTKAVADYLNANAGALFIDEVMAGADLELKFNSALKDPATPDIIVQPIYGTVYTGSGKKNAEHGGFSFADTNVGLVVSNPALRRRVLKSPVATSQVAASILKALGADPSELDAVRKEGTRVLPFLFEEGGGEE
jgi:hypothetical protein